MKSSYLYKTLFIAILGYCLLFSYSCRLVHQFDEYSTPEGTNTDLSSDNCFLSDITFENAILNEQFTKTKLSYTSTVESNISFVSLIAKSDNINSKLSIRVNTTDWMELLSDSKSENLNLVTGLNTIVIRVIAANNINIEYYTVNIFRKSSVYATLESINISTGVLNPLFQEDIFSYSIELPFDINEITIESFAKSLNSHIETNNPDGINNNVFKLNNTSLTINIIVIAENKESNTYSIIINKKVPVYTVTFETNGGTTIANQNITSGQTILESSTITTKTGYSFIGWYKEATFTNAWDFTNDKIAGDTTIYAKWLIIEKSLIYNGNGNTGGSAPPSTLLQYNSWVNLTTNTGNLAKTGATFAGWNTKPDGSGANYPEGTLNAFKMGDTDITLYASWTNLPLYTVTFETNGGTTIANQNITSGQTILESSTITTKTGYSFIGWYKEATFTNAWDFTNDKIAGDTTIYAKWQPINNITVTVLWRTEDTITPSTITDITKGDDLVVTIAEPYSTYKWFIDGDLQATQTAKTITYNTAPLFAGTHELSVIVTTLAGVQSLKSMRFNVIN